MGIARLGHASRDRGYLFMIGSPLVALQGSVKWWASRGPFHIASSLMGTGVSGAGSIQYLFMEPKNVFLGFSLGAMTVGIAGCQLRTYLLDRADEKRKRSTTTLDAMVVQLYSGILHLKDLESQQDKLDADLRICVLVPSPNGDSVTQVTNYVAERVRQRKGKGRQFSSKSGVVGAAIQQHQIAHSALPKGVGMVQHLITRWNYSKEEAQSLTSDRKSWIAVPIGEPGNLLCVIFCDSAHADFFGNKASVVRKLLRSCSIGFARALTEAYNSV